MKNGSRVTSILLAILLLVQLFAVIPTTAMAETEGDYYFITPKLSDGITIDKAQTDELYVKGYIEGENFVFTETKTLSFTAAFGEGWSYNEQYSSIFANDTANRKITVNSDNTVKVTYNAKAGSKIAFSDLTGLAINATAEKLPTLYIDIDGSFSSVNKNDWVPATYRLELGTKKFESGNYEGMGQVKGRGNSSWGMPQKPYSIKLEKKASLLDIPKTKKYAIVASYQDPARLRNYVTYKSGLKLNGIEYTPKCELVDVYLNGTYNGIYILVERIDIEPTKVDIEEATEQNITGGYIIEKDAGDKVNKSVDPWFNAPFQANPNEDLFTVKAPDPVTKEMLSYLENHMQKLHDALMGKSGEDYTKYIDIDTWVDFLIIQELSKNVDGNLKTSCYFYKEADIDTVYMTALWDFDYAYGLASHNNASSNNDGYDCPSGQGTSDFMVVNSSCPWFKTLHSKTDFHDALTKTYSEYRYSIIPEMTEMINEQAAYLSNSYQADAKKWGGKGNFTSGINSFKSFLSGRTAWLDKQWLLDDYVNTHSVTLNYSADQADVTADDANVVVDKGTKTYTINAKDGYELSKVTFNGIDVTNLVSGNTFTTPIIAADAAIDFEFTASGPAITFMADGQEIAVKYVVMGGTLTDIPEIPAKAHYDQVAPYWDVTDFTNITEDMTVNAVYTPNKYNVTFVGKDGAIIAAVPTTYLTAAVAPKAPEIENMRFIGWDKDISSITGEITVNAIYVDVTPGEYDPVTVTPSSLNVGVNDMFTLTVRTPANVTSVALKNENGKYLSRSMSFEIDPQNNAYLIWTVTTSIGTKGTGRKIAICTKTDADFVESGAEITVNVFAQTPSPDADDPCLIGARPIRTDKIAYQVKENITLTVTTNRSVNRLKLIGENGKVLGKISETCVDNGDGTATWTVVTSFGTKGENRSISVALIGANGTITDSLGTTSSLYIYKA